MRSILIVDDEPLILMYLEDLLTELGFSVTPRGGVDDALESLQDLSFDAAILDVNLGAGQDSFAVAGALAAKNVPFAFATGYGDSLPLGPFTGRPVLNKPFSSDQIESILDNLVGAASPR